VSVSNILHAMLVKVAQALETELCSQMTFVGGCATSLLLTDAFTKEQVRHTDDVDLIVNVMGYSDFYHLQNRLKQKGFVIRIPRLGEEIPTCAMFLEDLRVDFMPDNEQVLGFTNRWYKDAMQSATGYSLTKDITIQLISPVYFIATKLEAYKGRGNNDPFGSRDIEDILNLVDGRPELIGEIVESPDSVRSYIAREISNLLDVSDFEYMVQSQSGGDPEREQLLFKRLDKIAICYAN